MANNDENEAGWIEGKPSEAFEMRDLRDVNNFLNFDTVSSLNYGFEVWRLEILMVLLVAKLS